MGNSWLCLQGDSITEDTKSLSREELGRRIASRWTGEKTEQHEEVDSSIEKDHQNPDEIPNENNYEEDNGYASEDDEHRYDADDDDSKDQVDDFAGDDHYDSSPLQKPDSDDESDLGKLVLC